MAALEQADVHSALALVEARRKHEAADSRTSSSCARSRLQAALARVFLELGKYTDAAAALEPYRDEPINRQHLPLAGLLGVALSSRGEMQKALVPLEHAAGFTDDGAGIRVRLALARALRATGGDTMRADRLEREAQTMKR